MTGSGKNLPDATDQQLIRAASEHLLSRRRPGFHSVAAALLTGLGNIYVAIDLRSRKAPVCAEPCAVSAANSAGEYEIRRIAAVVLAGDNGGTAVISPCGACRELLHYHAPNCEVLVQESGDVWRVPIGRLYAFAAVPELPYSPTNDQ
jgi:cytidine deaminase